MSSLGRGLALALAAGGPWLSGCGRDENALAQGGRVLLLSPLGEEVGASEVSFDFGEVVLGSSREVGFRLSNVGGREVRNLGTRLEGAPTGAFFVRGLPQELPAGQQVDLVLTFAPPFSGEHSVRLQVQGNAHESAPAVALLEGRGAPSPE